MDRKSKYLLIVLYFLPITGCSIITDSSDLVGTKVQDDSGSGQDVADTGNIDPAKDASDYDSEIGPDSMDASDDSYIDSGIESGSIDAEVNMDTGNGSNADQSITCETAKFGLSRFDQSCFGL